MKITKSFRLIILLFFISIKSISQVAVNCKKNPIYKENGGYKRTTILNKTKVKKEAIAVMVCELMTAMWIANKNNTQTDNQKSEKDAIYIAKEKAIAETNNLLYSIAQKIEGKKIKNVKDYEDILETLKELRELKCKRVDPITKFLNKKINKIYGDISFKTGASLISEGGKMEISEIITEIKKDIDVWRNYINDCNEKVFESELFVLVIDVDGYADQQGAIDKNQALSQERANAVKTEIIRQLNSVIVNEKINIVFDKIQARGFGETLPPGVEQKGENDPSRRVCIINSLVGPTALLK